MVPDPSDDPKHPRSPRSKPGAKKTPVTVEDWLAQKLAALDPGGDEDEDEEDVPTRAMRQVKPTTARVSRSTDPARPGPDPARSVMVPEEVSVRPAAAVLVPAPPAPAAVPAADEWPDFEPLTFPSDEIEPLDPPDAVLPTPGAPFLAPETTVASPDAAVQQDFAVPVPGPDALVPEATVKTRTPPPAVGMVPEPARRTPTGPPGRGSDTEEDESMWDLFGDADARRPSPFGAPTADAELTHPGRWATPAPAPARGSPVITSTPAPVRPRVDDDARVDALIAEVERKAPPIRVAVRHGAEPVAPRRKSGPFSRTTPATSDSVDEEGTLTEADGSFVDALSEPDHVGTFDEVFPSTDPRDAARPAAGAATSAPVPVPPPPVVLKVLRPPVAEKPSVVEETEALLANSDFDRPTHVAEDERDPGTTWTVEPLGSRIGEADADLTKRSTSVDENALADEKTEIRSFKPIVPDPVEDVPTLVGQQRVIDPEDSWSVPAAEPTGAAEAAVSELSWSLITWLMIAIGMLPFAILLGLLVILIVSFLRV